MALEEMKNMPAVQVPAEARTLTRYYSGGQEDQEEWNQRNRERAEAAAAEDNLQALADINALTMLHDQSLAAEEQLHEMEKQFEEEGW